MKTKNKDTSPGTALITGASSGIGLQLGRPRGEGSPRPEPTTKQFPQQLVRDHMQTNAELIALADLKGIDLPPASAQPLETWADKDPVNLAREYLPEMKKDHEATLALFQQAARSADGDIATFAQHTLLKLEEHLQQLDRIRSLPPTTTP